MDSKTTHDAFHSYKDDSLRIWAYYFGLSISLHQPLHKLLR